MYLIKSHIHKYVCTFKYDCIDNFKLYTYINTYVHEMDELKCNHNLQYKYNNTL